MSWIKPELCLDVEPNFVLKTINDFIKEISVIENSSEKYFKLYDFLKLIEEEMDKIDAFKRELPLCMLILKDAIAVLHEQLIECRPRNRPPACFEFFPVKNRSSDEGRDGLPVPSSIEAENNGENSITDNHNVEEIKRLKKTPRFPGRKIEEKEELPVAAELTLATPDIMKNSVEECGSVSIYTPSSLPNLLPPSSPPPPPPQEGAKKQRRCWSSDLHRHFVNALQQLGGPQVATPKQIKEVMQVDGLTNDEVKSHLQKYRLHTRKHQPSTSGNNSITVLGGSSSRFWMGEPRYGASINGTTNTNTNTNNNNTPSSSTQGPLQYPRGIIRNGEDNNADSKSVNFAWRK